MKLFEIDDAALLPPEFLKLVEQIDKAGAKAALKAGKNVPGAHLETRHHL